VTAPAIEVPAGALQAFETLSALRLEDDRQWIEAATDWQIADALAVLDPDAPQRNHYLSRPRGGSKTTDLAGIGIAWLLDQAPPGARGYVIASDLEQGAELVMAARGLLTRTPGMASLLKVDAFKITNAASGAQLFVLAADGASAFGKLPSLTIVDEHAQWPDTLNAETVWTAVASAIVKVADHRLVILTTAGNPAHPAFKVLEEARADPAHWRVHELPGPLPWRSEDDLVVQRSLLTEWQYDRLHLNKWTAADDLTLDLAQVRACVTHEGHLEWTFLHGSPYVVTVDLATSRDNCVVCVAHLEPAGKDRRVVVDALRVWTPTREKKVPLEDVELEIESLSIEYAGAKRSRHGPACRVVFDPAEGRLMMDRLRTRGIPVEPFQFTNSSVGILGTLLVQLFRDELISLPDDEALIDELAHIRLKETHLGAVRIDHDSGRHDDRAVAIAMAANALLTPAFWSQPIDVASWTAPKNRYDYDLRAHSEPWESGSLLKVEF
jgi:phage terminase large subunit-like protein